MGSLQQILKDARSSYANKQSAKGKKKPNMKRIIKNLKYGSGYTHKGIKGKNKNRNTYSSSMNYQYDWKRSKFAERSQSGGFARGTKKFNSNYKRRSDERKGIVRGGYVGNNKGDPSGYHKNVKRQNRILGKNKKRGSGKRPGKNARQRMNRR